MFRFNSFNKCKLTKRPPPSVSINKIIVIRRINFIDLWAQSGLRFRIQSPIARGIVIP
jgi:hypothetical protein